MGNSNARLISNRIRRQWFWLGLAIALHVAAMFVVLTSVVGSRVAPVEAVLAVALVIGVPIAGVWLERRDAVRRRPARWLRRALGVVVPNAVAVGLVSGAVTDGPGQALLAVGLVVAQLACVVLAARAMRYPVRPELGEMALEVTAKVRSDHQSATPTWALQDEVHLTDREFVAVLRPGPTSAFGIGVRLADVTGVSVRPARPDDGPWARLDGGQYFVSEGDVVEVRHRDGALVVPVCNAAAFAEVIRSRIAARQGMPTKG